MKTIFGLVLMFIQFFIPVIILIICYGKIVWVLTQRINTDLIEDKSSKMAKHDIENTGKDKFELARRNTIKTLLIVGLCFIICWSQNQVRYFMHNCGYEIDFRSTYHQVAVLMVFLNCTVNPFIYLIKNRDYQEACRTFFHSNKEQEGKSRSKSTTMSISHPTRLTDI